MRLGEQFSRKKRKIATRVDDVGPIRRNYLIGQLLLGFALLVFFQNCSGDKTSYAQETCGELADKVSSCGLPLTVDINECEQNIIDTPELEQINQLTCEAVSTLANSAKADGSCNWIQRLMGRCENRTTVNNRQTPFTNPTSNGKKPVEAQQNLVTCYLLCSDWSRMTGSSMYVHHSEQVKPDECGGAQRTYIEGDNEYKVCNWNDSPPESSDETEPAGHYDPDYCRNGCM